MIVGSIARRYAKALLAIGIEDKSYEKQGKELAQFAALMDDTALRETLENPSYPQSQRKAIIQELLKRQRPSKTLESFILLLTDRKRMSFLQAISREYGRMVDVHVGRVRAGVTSATRLAPAEVDRLKKALEQQTGKQVILEQSTDPELIAGIVTQVGSIVYDGSIRTRLQQMRQTLLHGE